MIGVSKLAVVLFAASAACASAGSYSFSNTDISQNDNAVVKPADPVVSSGGYNGSGKPTATGNDSPVQKIVTPAPSTAPAPATTSTGTSTKVTPAPVATTAKPTAAVTQAPKATPVATSTGKTTDTAAPKATPATTSTGKSTGTAPSATPASTSTGTTTKTKAPCPTLPQPDVKTKAPCPTLPQPNLPAATPASSQTKAASVTDDASQQVLDANTKSAATRVVPALAAVAVSAVYLLL